MSLCKVHYVDVVSYATSVRSVVIVSKDAQVVSDSGSRLGYERYQVLGHSSWEFAYECGRMGTYGVEVSQGADLKVRVCYYAVGKDLLSHLLALAVRGEASFKRSILSNRQMFLVRLTVNRAGRREDYVCLLAFFRHQSYEVQE